MSSGIHSMLVASQPLGSLPGSRTLPSTPSMFRRPSLSHGRTHQRAGSGSGHSGPRDNGGRTSDRYHGSHHSLDSGSPTDRSADRREYVLPELVGYGVPERRLLSSPQFASDGGRHSSPRATFYSTQRARGPPTAQWAHDPTLNRPQTEVPPQPGPSAQGRGGRPLRRRPQQQVLSACSNCKRDHLSCDNNRPCTRCVTTNKQVSCRLLSMATISTQTYTSAGDMPRRSAKEARSTSFAGQP